MHVSVKPFETGMKLTVYDESLFTAVAWKGLLKVTADVVVNGVSLRGSITANKVDEALTVHTVKATINVAPRSKGYGTNRYEVNVDGRHYLLETYFGANYQCLVVWETDSNGKTIRVGGISYDPVEKSLIIREDTSLFVDVMQSLLK